MGLDIQLIGPEGNKEVIYQSQKKRFKTFKDENGQEIDIVAKCEDLYMSWKKARGGLDTLKMVRGQIQKKIAEKKKANKTDPCEELMKEKAENDEKIKEGEKNIIDLEEELHQKYSKIGNIVHDSVPVSSTEDDNKIEKEWGTPNKMEINETEYVFNIEMNISYINSKINKRLNFLRIRYLDKKFLMSGLIVIYRIVLKTVFRRSDTK